MTTSCSHWNFIDLSPLSLYQISKTSFSTCIPPFCKDLIMRTEFLELEDSATLQALKTALNQQKLRNKWLQYLISRRPGNGPCTSSMPWVPNPTAEATRSCPDTGSFWFLFHFTGDILCVCVLIPRAETYQWTSDGSFEHSGLTSELYCYKFPLSWLITFYHPSG